ncbi:class III lanthionine synthetase LanKC [Williamsia sp. MIQD14]|uniref:class III lanthionine synthetase LanKC n=1 Tax=Williamsia sp. MIQD14 TaxID=3425703 RepID=UPI003DA0A66A
MHRMTFCPAGSPFYDTVRTPPDDPGYGTDLDLPAGWHRLPGEDWTMIVDTGVTLPLQGWKIHVSATHHNAAEVLARCWSYLVDGGHAFKHLRSQAVLLRRNGKYGDRSGSGKFVTIYPPDLDTFTTVLTELDPVLAGLDGPYILSDLRWRQGPLYVRYGGFVPRPTRTRGGRVAYCIEDPQGRLVEDSRRPGFHPPDWVTVPAVLQPALEARARGTLEGFPYRVDRALHFSNGGGVYAGRADTDDAPVLIREARPHAGVDLRGEDATDRLMRERDAIDRLDGLGIVPRVIDLRRGHEHDYLIREFVDGVSLLDAAARRRAECPAAEYVAWAGEMTDRVDAAVTVAGERGLTLGDVHLGNVMVGADDRISLIDLETASTEPDALQVHAAAGFQAPPSYRGPRIDRYSLGCLRLAVFSAALTTTLPWNSDALDLALDLIAVRYDPPDTFARRVRADLGSARPLGFSGTEACRPAPTIKEVTDVPAVRSAILAWATPERTDRLYPGDCTSFSVPEGGLSLGYGAAGVIWALQVTGATIPDDHRTWLREHPLLADPRPADMGWGLYTGLTGVVHTLAVIGETEIALRIARTALRDALTSDETADRHGVDLFSGLAGIGLTLTDLADRTGDGDLVDLASAVLDRVATRWDDDRHRAVAPGLLSGWSGPALFAARLHDLTGDDHAADLAVRFLAHDVAAFDHRPEPGVRTALPGPLGTALVAAQFAADAAIPAPSAESWAAHATRLSRRGGHRHIGDGAGLAAGWAGGAVCAAILDRHGLVDPDVRDALTDPTELRVYSSRLGDEIGFLGQDNWRLSIDLLTGSAGVLLAVHALDGGPVTLPLLSRPV